MTRRRFGNVFLTVFVLAFLVSGSTVALAGTAYSQISYVTVAGKQYRNYATIMTGVTNAYARTNSGPNEDPASAGWVSSRGRLFTSSGALSCEGTNQYNSATLQPEETVVGYSCYRYLSGSWYSYGVSQYWNGSGYSAHYTYRSPNQNS